MLFERVMCKSHSIKIQIIPLYCLSKNPFLPRVLGILTQGIFHYYFLRPNCNLGYTQGGQYGS